MSTQTYSVTFDRIGRNHHVAPLVVEVDGPQHLADLIHAYARPYLRSREVSVWLGTDNLRGGINCGFHNGGTFTLNRLADGVS